MRRYALAALSIAGLLAVMSVAFAGGTIEVPETVPPDQTPVKTSLFRAGTLSIAVRRGGGDTVPGPLFYGTAGEGGGEPGLYPTGLWAPGDTHRRILEVANVGTLDAMVQGLSANLTGGSRRLAQQLQVKVTTDVAGTNPVVWGSLADFMATPQWFTKPLELGTGQSAAVYVWVTLPLSTDNTYQGLSSVISFTVHAEQSKFNKPKDPPDKPELG